MHMSSYVFIFQNAGADLWFIQSRGRFSRSPLSRHVRTCSNIRWISWRFAAFFQSLVGFVISLGKNMRPGRRCLVIQTYRAQTHISHEPIQTRQFFHWGLLCLGIPIQIHCSCAPVIIANGTAIKFEIRCISIEGRQDDKANRKIQTQLRA